MRWFLAILMVWATSQGVFAQDMRAQAQILPDAVVIDDRLLSGQTDLSLRLSQPVPHRIYTLNTPNRLVIEFLGVMPIDLGPYSDSRRIKTLNMMWIGEGWSRLIAELVEPVAIVSAGMTVHEQDGSADLVMQLSRASQGDFDAASGVPSEVRRSPDLWAGASSSEPFKNGSRTLRVMLDPGHGGIDPGALRDGIEEAALMLAMARELQEVLRRAGGFEVFLTRDADVFVPLETRVALAQQTQADVFISLHADALAEGRAEGATVYILSEQASDQASAALAARHDRDDILGGLDLSVADDQIATVLLDIARQDSAPRSLALANKVIAGIQNAVGRVNARPLRQAGFSVLKSADIPSILIEVGFLSTQADLRNLKDPLWRARLAAGIRDGLQVWAIEDAALQRLRFK